MSAKCPHLSSNITTALFMFFMILPRWGKVSVPADFEHLICTMPFVVITCIRIAGKVRTSMASSPVQQITHFKTISDRVHDLFVCDLFLAALLAHCCYGRPCFLERWGGHGSRFGRRLMRRGWGVTSRWPSVKLLHLYNSDVGVRGKIV